MQELHPTAKFKSSEINNARACGRVISKMILLADRTNTRNE